MFAKLSEILPSFPTLSREDKIQTVLCPASNTAAKFINKFICIMFKGRDKIEEGLHTSLLTFPPQVSDYCRGTYEAANAYFGPHAYLGALEGLK